MATILQKLFVEIISLFLLHLSSRLRVLEQTATRDTRAKITRTQHLLT